MNIIMISYWSCPLARLGVLAAGGMNVYVLNLVNTLGKLGHRIDIYTRVHKEEDEKVLVLHENVRIIHLKTSKADLYRDVKYYSERLLDYIKGNQLSYNVLHSHYFYSGLIGVQLSSGLSLPHLHTFHTLGLVKRLYGGINDPKRIRAERLIIDKISAIIASTELEKDDLIKRYKVNSKKIFVVSPGVNHFLFKNLDRQFSRVKLNLPQDKKIILFVGRIDPIKGISFLIEAIGKLTQKYPSFENIYRVLLIGGDLQSRYFWQNQEVKKIQYLIAEKNLECCVKFIGSRPHTLLPYYYCAADIVVMPSVYESFGLVVLEAMACGSCILASRVGGLKYLIKDKLNGRLFDSGNIEQLGRIIWELLNDKQQRIKLGQRALNASQEFCWDKQAKKILDVYKCFL